MSILWDARHEWGNCRVEALKSLPVPHRSAVLVRFISGLLSPFFFISRFAERFHIPQKNRHFIIHERFNKLIYFTGCQMPHFVIV